LYRVHVLDPESVDGPMHDQPLEVSLKGNGLVNGFPVPIKISKGLINFEAIDNTVFMLSIQRVSTGPSMTSHLKSGFSSAHA